MNSTEIEVLKIAVAFLSGGLAGAVLNYLVSRRRQQVEFVIKVCDKYLDDFDEIAVCKAILADSSQLRDLGQLNRVRRLGDWFELIAIYHASNYLSKQLLEKVGLFSELRKFHELVGQRKNDPESPLNDAWLWWVYLDKLVRGLK